MLSTVFDPDLKLLINERSGICTRFETRGKEKS